MSYSSFLSVGRTPRSTKNYGSVLSPFSKPRGHPSIYITPPKCIGYNAYLNIFAIARVVKAPGIKLALGFDVQTDLIDQMSKENLIDHYHVYLNPGAAPLNTPYIVAAASNGILNSVIKFETKS